jgi:hypothetical protein
MSMQINLLQSFETSSVPRNSRHYEKILRASECNSYTMVKARE